MKSICYQISVFLLITINDVKPAPVMSTSNHNERLVCNYMSHIESYCTEGMLQDTSDLVNHTIPILQNYLDLLKSYYERFNGFNEIFVDRSLDEALKLEDDVVLQNAYCDLMKTACYLNQSVVESELSGYIHLNHIQKHMLSGDMVNFNVLLCNIKELVVESTDSICYNIEINSPRSPSLRTISEYTVITTLNEYLHGLSLYISRLSEDDVQQPFVSTF